MGKLDCLFCQLAADSSSPRVVWSDAEHVAFLDANPIAPGHLLLIPRIHVRWVDDLVPDGYGRLFARARALMAPVAMAAGAPRTGIVVEGFGVDHAHVHLVPIWHGGGIDPCRQMPAREADRLAAAERLRRVIPGALET